MADTKEQDRQTLHRVAMFENREVWLFWADPEGLPVQDIDWPDDWPAWVSYDFASPPASQG
jgi:hypothetical protein